MDERHIFSFEKLIAWQKARSLVSKVYRITSNFPNAEQFGMTSQMRRAAVSISSNIAEGTGKFSLKEKQRFIRIAYSSILELYSQSLVASDLSFISHEDLEGIASDVQELSRILSGLTKSYQAQAKL